MKRQTIYEAYLSGLCAGSNAASGQGPYNEPTRGKTKRDQAYYDGWHKGHDYVRQIMEAQKIALQAPRYI